LINYEISYDIVVKRHLRQRCPLFESAQGAMAPPCLHSPAFLCILLYKHSLYSLQLAIQCVTVMNIN